MKPSLKAEILDARDDDPRLDYRPGARKLIKHLAKHLNDRSGSPKVWPGRARLHELMKYGRGTNGALARLTKQLIELGYVAGIEVERRGRIILRETYTLRAPTEAERRPAAEQLSIDFDATSVDSRRVLHDSLVSPARLTGESDKKKNSFNELLKEGGGVSARARPQLVDLERLEAELVAAAGDSLDTIDAATGMRALGEVLSWLNAKPPCDLELDVLPTIRALAQKADPKTIRRWKYFRRAVLAARDDRLREHPPPAAIGAAEFFPPTEEFSRAQNSDRDRQSETRAERLLRIARADALRRQDSGTR